MDCMLRFESPLSLPKEEFANLKTSSPRTASRGLTNVRPTYSALIVHGTITAVRNSSGDQVGLTYHSSIDS